MAFRHTLSTVVELLKLSKLIALVILFTFAAGSSVSFLTLRRAKRLRFSSYDSSLLHMNAYFILLLPRA